MFRSVRIPLFVLIALAVGLGAAEAARTYKWVDDDGVTHYSQYPPPDGEAEIIDPSIGLPSGSGSDSGNATTDGPETGNETAESGGDADESPQDMEAYCNQLRRQEQMLAGDGAVSMRRDDGSLEPLSGDARAERRAEIQTRIEMHCS